MSPPPAGGLSQRSPAARWSPGSPMSPPPAVAPCWTSGARSLGRDPLHRVERLLQPVAEVALPGDQIEDAVLDLPGIHAEPGVDERAVLGLRQQHVDEGAGVDAADHQLLAVLHAVHVEQHVVLAHGSLDHLAVCAARLEIVLALDLEHAWPPVRMAIDVLEKLPDDVNGRLDVCLLAGLRHRG